MIKMLSKGRSKNINLIMIDNDSQILGDKLFRYYVLDSYRQVGSANWKARMTEGMSDEDKEKFLSSYEKSKRAVEERSKEFFETVFGKGGN